MKYKKITIIAVIIFLTLVTARLFSSKDKMDEAVFDPSVYYEDNGSESMTEDELEAMFTEDELNEIDAILNSPN